MEKIDEQIKEPVHKIIFDVTEEELDIITGGFHISYSSGR